MSRPLARTAERVPESISRGAILLTVASGLFIASGYAVNVWLGRLLGPGEYGRFSVIIAMVTLLNVLQNASVPQAVARYTAGHPRDAAGLLRTGLILQLGIGLGLLVALAAGAAVIASTLGDPGLADALRASAVILPPYGVFALLLAYHNGRRRYTHQAVAQASYAISKAVAVIALAYPLRLVGAIVGYIVAALVGLVAATERPTVGGPGVGAVRLLLFAGPLSLYALASVGQFSVDILFVKAFSGVQADAGLYAASQNLARIPYFLVTGLAVLVLPALAGSAREGKDVAARTAQQALRVTVLAVVPIAALLAGTAPGVLDLLYGSEYAAGSGALSVLAVAMGALAVASVAAAALSGMGHPGSSALIAVLGLLMTVVPCALFVPVLGSPGAAIAVALSAAVTISLLLWRLAVALPGVVPMGSILRVVAVSAAVAAALALLDARGLMLVLGYVAASVVGAMLLLVIGEIGRDDVARLKSALGRR